MNLNDQATVPPRNSTKRAKLTKEQRRERALARATARAYHHNGKIAKRRCFICGSTKHLEFHHPDYAAALEVICVCHSDHQKLTYGKLSLIPVAVQTQLQFDKALRLVEQQFNIARIVRKIQREVGGPA